MLRWAGPRVLRSPLASLPERAARRRSGEAIVSEALVLVVVLWAAAMVPSAVRARNASPHVTVGGFERAMEVLRSEQRATPGRRVMVPSDPERIVQRAVGAPGSGGSSGAPGPGGASRTPPTGGSSSLPVSPRSGRRFRREDPRVARRRAWFERLLAASVAALAAGVVLGGWFWLLAAVVVTGTVGYTVRLRRLKLQRDEARRVVREFDRGLGGGADDGASRQPPAARAEP